MARELWPSIRWCHFTLSTGVWVEDGMGECPVTRVTTSARPLPNSWTSLRCCYNKYINTAESETCGQCDAGYLLSRRANTAFKSLANSVQVTLLELLTSSSNQHNYGPYLQGGPKKLHTKLMGATSDPDLQSTPSNQEKCKTEQVYHASWNLSVFLHSPIGLL